MVNIIWSCMAIIGIIYAILNGTMDDVNEAIFESAQEAVTLSIGLISVLVFWLGIMKIAEKANILKVLAKLLKPIVVKLFPDIPPGHPAMGYITTIGFNSLARTFKIFAFSAIFIIPSQKTKTLIKPIDNVTASCALSKIASFTSSMVPFKIA